MFRNKKDVPRGWCQCFCFCQRKDDSCSYGDRRVCATCFEELQEMQPLVVHPAP